MYIINKTKGRAGIAQLVERNLAKVEVAGSNPVSRSIFLRRHSQVAKATVCKIVITGSNPVAASKFHVLIFLISINSGSGSFEQMCYFRVGGCEHLFERGEVLPGLLSPAATGIQNGELSVSQ